jgi:hypothetical protein
MSRMVTSPADRSLMFMAREVYSHQPPEQLMSLASGTRLAVAFVTGDRVLKKVSLADGLVTTIEVDADFAGSGGAWGPDDIITFARRGTLWQSARDAHQVAMDSHSAFWTSHVSDHRYDQKKRQRREGTPGFLWHTPEECVCGPE